MITAEHSAPKWNYNDIIVFAFLGVICVVASQLLAAWLAQVLKLAKTDKVLLLMPAQLLLYALLLAALYCVLKMQPGISFLPALGWVAFPFSGVAALLYGFLLAVANAAASRFLQTPQVDTPVRHLFDRRITAWEFGLIGTTLGPLCEELVFRGFLQPVFVRSLGPAFGIIVTAALFGSLHLAQNEFVWQSGVLITLAGVAFGWMRQLSGSTRASTLMHSAYNLTYFVAAFSQTGHPLDK